MEKTKEQVVRYLSRRAYSESDWKVILSFCLKRFGSGARCSQRPKYKSTVDEFMRWIQYGVGDGDIVTDARNRMGVYFDDGTNGYFAAMMNEGQIVVRKSVCRDPVPVKPYVAERFYEVMTEQRLIFKISLSSIVDIDIPEPGTRCKLMCGGKVYVGIFGHASGRSARFVFLVCNGELLKDVEFDTWDIAFLKNGTNDLKQIHDALSRNGLMYDKGSRTLVEVSSRQSKGGSYWFITDKLTVMCVADTGTMVHKARYDCHNYFSSYRDAEEMRRYLAELGERFMKKRCR